MGPSSLSALFCAHPKSRTGNLVHKKALGCVTLYTGVPKVIKCLLHGAQLMSLVINDSPSEKNLKILHFLIWTKAFEVYLLAVCSGRS